MLSADEALVLFEFASRFSNDKKLVIEDPSEEVALWGLCALLESQLVEPFAENYAELLERARAALRANGGDRAG